MLEHSVIDLRVHLSGSEVDLGDLGARRLGAAVMPQHRDIIDSMEAEGGRAVEDRAQRVPITFPEELYERLREASFRRHVPMSEIVRAAVREYFDRNDPQLRLPLNRDASR